MDIEKDLENNLKLTKDAFMKYTTIILRIDLLLASVIWLESQTQKMVYQQGQSISESRVVEDSLRARCPNSIVRRLRHPYIQTSMSCQKSQQVIANMMFNLGLDRLSAFKGMKAGCGSRDWNEAADQMVDSRWYRQVGARAERLVERIIIMIYKYVINGDRKCHTQ